MTFTRRSMLTSLLAGPCVFGDETAGQAPSQAPDPTLYIPKAHLVADRQFLHDFMDEHAFVDLVTTAPTLRITHIPVWIDRGRGRFGTIVGHLAAQNPQSRTLDGRQAAVIVFRGPHGYISPTWYAKRDVAPTWNFAVVHASGRPTTIPGEEGAREVLARLIQKFEAEVGSDFALSKIPDTTVANLVKNIVPFSMEIDALEGKFKLGQERTEGDRQGVLTHLREGRYRETSLQELTESFYKRQTTG